MTAANPWWKRIFAGLWAALKAQPLATGLYLPLLVAVIVLGVQVKIARDDAREARFQSINLDRMSKIQDSGKALDLALAAYFQSISDLGLAERELRMPGTYADTPVPQAQAAVVEARRQARIALADHASDVQRLRGSLDAAASRRYMATLADINTTVEGNADIDRTGANITALGKLVVARNALVDEAMKKVG
jgi:hypothetical protein